jgi:cob(I)alamin adenosyltransferase
VPKDSLRIEAFGTVDELNSAIGLALAAGLADPIVEPLKRIQNDLFHLGSDLCVLEADKPRRPVPCIEARHIEALEKLMDELSTTTPPLRNFVLPGGSAGGAALHFARSVCRRAERLVVALTRSEAVGELTVRYLNRLSDALFVMARYENLAKGAQEPTWNSRA